MTHMTIPGYKTKFILAIILALIIISPAYAEKPLWITDRPINDSFYIGIGVCAKDNPDLISVDYRKTARDHALSEIASQITVNVSNERSRSIFENSKSYEDEIKEYIQSSTKATLHNVDFSGEWEDNNNYWVYLKLNKADYLKQKSEKLAKLIDLSKDFLIQAKKDEREGLIYEALLCTFKAIKSIENYINEPVKVTLFEREVFLVNEIIYNLNSILGRIDLRAENNAQNVKAVKSAEYTALVTALYKPDDKSKYNIPNLPLRCHFIRGDGDLIDKNKTDNLGVALFSIFNLSPENNVHIARVEIDRDKLLGEDTCSYIIQSILNSLPWPEAEFQFLISNLKALIESDELLFESKHDFAHLGTRLKEILANHEFSFVDDISNADIIFKIKANSRRGSKIQNGFFSAFVDFTISGEDRLSGNEVFKTSVNGIKGFGTDFTSAGSNAYENAADNIDNTLVQEMINKF
jgi:LPP20 lipoprotein